VEEVKTGRLDYTAWAAPRQVRLQSRNPTNSADASVIAAPHRNDAGRKLSRTTCWPAERGSPRNSRSARAMGTRSPSTVASQPGYQASATTNTAGAAAGVINTLGLIEAIPALINAQVVGSGGNGGGNNGDTSLAYIMIATQQAFVRDLTPVVGDSAVGFDPDLGVVSDGVYLRVLDASVVTYRTEVHSALVALTQAISMPSSSSRRSSTPQVNAPWAPPP